MLTRATVRAFSTEALQVLHDVARQQFVVSCHGREAFLTYKKFDKGITLVRTEVPKEFGGKGVGSLLAKTAFDYAKENKLNVVCQCHFLAHYYERHKVKYESLKIKFDLIEEDENKK